MMRKLLHVVIGLLFCAGCTNKQLDGWTTIDLDKRNADALLNYYFSTFVPQTELATVLNTSDGKARVNLEALRTKSDWPLDDDNGDGIVDWDELKSAVQAAYNDRAEIPRNLQSINTDNENWMRLDISGSMTDARRDIFVDESEVVGALERYKQNENQIIYDAGTTFIAHHYVDSVHIESTFMRKRTDGQWDFAVYDSSGYLTDRTTTPPKELLSPTQCVGCHFGSKLFEPEKSYPGQAKAGPSGPRAVHYPLLSDHDSVVQTFQEHARRSDKILGLYGTVYTARLIEKRRQGTATEKEIALLESLGF